MSIFNKIGHLLETKKIKQPIFVKEFSAENSQLIELMQLVATLKSGTKKEIVERDITFLKHGLEGEKNVAFELKNAFLPILCLHDIRLEFEDYVAQFDFIVISSKFICILETKKLNGDIEITKDGDFIRTIKGHNGRFIKKEGMYSPISQNERHVNILKEILTREKLIVDLPIKSLVVMANPKTILNKSKCSKAIQSSIYKYDQVISFLKRHQEDKTSNTSNLEINMYKISDFLLANNKPLKMDYIAKYGFSEDDFIAEEQSKNDSLKDTATYSNVINERAKTFKTADIKRTVSKEQNMNKNSQDLVGDLKKYRLKVSKEEGIKPYYVFSDKELEDLIKTMPRNKKELMNIKGFAEKKVAMYGDEIIRILKG